MKSVDIALSSKVFLPNLYKSIIIMRRFNILPIVCCHVTWHVYHETCLYLEQCMCKSRQLCRGWFYRVVNPSALSHKLNLRLCSFPLHKRNICLSNRLIDILSKCWQSFRKSLNRRALFYMVVFFYIRAYAIRNRFMS